MTRTSRTNYPGFNGTYTPLVAGSAAADGSSGNVYGCSDTGGQTLDVFNMSSTSILTSYPIPTGRGCGNQMAMDGTGHIFAVTGGTAPGVLDEFTVTGAGITPVSPTFTGYTGTSSGETPTVNPDPNAPPLFTAGTGVSHAGVMGVAVDGSGNLWILNEDTGTTASPGNVLVEFIGIAAPVVTPRFQCAELWSSRCAALISTGNLRGMAQSCPSPAAILRIAMLEQLRIYRNHLEK